MNKPAHKRDDFIASEVKYRIELARMRIEEAKDFIIAEDGLVEPGWEAIKQSLDTADGKLLDAHSEIAFIADPITAARVDAPQETRTFCTCDDEPAAVATAGLECPIHDAEDADVFNICDLCCKKDRLDDETILDHLHELGPVALVLYGDGWKRIDHNHGDTLLCDKHPNITYNNLFRVEEKPQ